MPDAPVAHENHATVEQSDPSVNKSIDRCLEAAQTVSIVLEWRNRVDKLDRDSVYVSEAKSENRKHHPLATVTRIP